MTVSSIVDLIRGILNDDATTKFWPDVDLIQFLDEGQKMFCSLATDDALASLQTTTLLTLGIAPTSLSVGLVTVPANCYQFRIARVRRSSTGIFRTAQTVPLEQLFSIERGSPMSTESPGAGSWDAPKVAVFGAGLYFSPTSSAEVTEGVQLFYQLTLTALTNAASLSAPQINDTHHPILAEWGCAQAFQKIGDSERASYHRQNFMDYIAGVNGKWTNRSMAQPAPKRVASNDVPRGV